MASTRSTAQTPADALVILARHGVRAQIAVLAAAGHAVAAVSAELLAAADHIEARLARVSTDI